ncbi:unnamed protein product [Rotaria sordida]|uniref:N-acetyltransferase domain-containing protein n=1 Tax=Rotaria sordida TaxID=392033 RepID=A0A815QWA7_9BILA|nr:unnamed protein product [Rotaria sordida]CAF1469158.1 unnamed protein product [Rotaria sordida]
MTSSRYEIDDEIYITDLLTNEDIPSFVKYLNNPTIYTNTLKIPYPYSTNDGEDFIKFLKSESLNSTRFFTIRLQANNELIGACGLHRSIKNERRTEIGYWLGKNEWKNLVRIEAQIFHWNKASMRVVEKCGFTFEGILRKRVHKNGQDIDVHLYALILE